MKEIDARGLACPAPVLQTKAILDEGNMTELKVIVDNAAAQQNVQRFLASRGFETRLESAGDDFAVLGTGKAGATQACACTTDAGAEPAPAHQKIMVLVATDCLGTGDDSLGRQLMINFIKTLDEMGPDLWRLVFVNNGVKLTIDDSAVLAELQAYEKRGLHILVCGTCLNHFNLLDRKQVGETTNMLDIVTAMQLADKVINV